MEESTGDVDDSFGLLGDEDEVSEAGKLKEISSSTMTSFFLMDFDGVDDVESLPWAL